MRYRDIPCLCAASLAALLGCASPTAAAWPPDGVPLCTGCVAQYPLICSDGAGGAFVVWGDSREPGDIDIYVQRVLASGAIAPGWPVDGAPACTTPRSQLLDLPPAADGFGGVIVVWRDRRNVVEGGTSVDIFAQRILGDGTIAPGWPVDGTPVTVAPGVQDFPIALADGAGGAFVAWDDASGVSVDIYLQHLTATGEPAPGWPANGLAVCTEPSYQCCPFGLVSDGSGGVFVAWHDERDGPLAVYAQRVHADASIAPGWPENGMRIVLGRGIRELIPDGAGGAYLSCATLRGLGDGEYYLQRFTGAGTIAPGWPEGGAPVCAAPDERHGIRMVSDDAGGALLTWHDYREFFDDEVYVQRLRPDGSLHPGWPLDGLRVTDNDLFDSTPDLAPDGMSGAYLSWDRFVGDGDRITVSRVTAAGGIAPGWPSGGQQIPSDVPSGGARITSDGMGGAIVAWERSDMTLRALRLGVDGPVPVLLALVSAEAMPDRVVLRWQGIGAASLAASVERRTGDSDWERLGSPDRDGGDGLRYEDRTVIAGTRYAYRLGYLEEGSERFTLETWLEVPALRFALRGLTPNPAVGPPVVSFSLVSGEPASLELYDLSGRLILAREVGSLGAGVHAERLSDRGHLPAGVYTVRLRQGMNIATARAVVLR